MVIPYPYLIQQILIYYLLTLPCKVTMVVGRPTKTEDNFHKRRRLETVIMSMVAAGGYYQKSFLLYASTKKLLSLSAT